MEETKSASLSTAFAIQGCAPTVGAQAISIIDLNFPWIQSVNSFSPANAQQWNSVFLVGYKVKLTYTNQTAIGANTFNDAQSHLRITYVRSRLDAVDLGITSGFATFSMTSLAHDFGQFASGAETSYTAPLDFIFDRNKCKVVKNKVIGIKPALAVQAYERQLDWWLPVRQRKRVLKNIALTLPQIQIAGLNDYLIFTGSIGKPGQPATIAGVINLDITSYYKLS